MSEPTVQMWSHETKLQKQKRIRGLTLFFFHSFPPPPTLSALFYWIQEIAHTASKVNGWSHDINVLTQLDVTCLESSYCFYFLY